MKDDDALAQHAGDRLTAINEASMAAARELNGALTALLLYMGEIRQHSPALAHENGDKRYLQTIVENALQQAERLCALVEQIAAIRKPAKNAANRGGEVRSDHPRRGHGLPATPVAGTKPTRREREVLTLIVEGCTNKQGAQKMKISPRTFESHRAEVMRKLGARNTAELVRAALLLLSKD